MYGIDLEFLGFGVAQSAPTEIVGMTSETLDGRAVYKLEERASAPNPRFELRRTWIDAKSFIPVRTEHLRDDRVVLSAETLEVSEVQGIATPRRMRFHKPIEKREVLLSVDAVDYEAPIDEQHFSALALLRDPGAEVDSSHAQSRSEEARAPGSRARERRAGPSPAPRASG